MYIKSFIIKYISLKILLNDTQKNGEYKIPSENKLAIKFNCGRLTSRSALTILESQGILKSKKGAFYYIQNQATRILMFPKFIFDKFPNIRNDENHILIEDELFGKCYQITTYHYNPEKKENGQVVWLLNDKLYERIKNEINESSNICELILKNSEFSNNIEENFFQDKNKNIFIKQIHRNYENIFLFQSSSTTDDLDTFSKRNLLLYK